MIGNPPFGTCSNLAIKFFNKASEVASYITFILPRTFRKESIQRKLNKFFHLIYDEDLPKNSFLVAGKEHDVPTVFQIWKKEKEPKKFEKFDIFSNDYIRWVTKEQAEFVIRRVGGNAGKVFYNTNLKNFNINSNYFCREKKKVF